jgi:hypothetical protein
MITGTNIHTRRCTCGEKLHIFDALTGNYYDPASGDIFPIWAADSADVSTWWRDLGTNTRTTRHDIQTSIARWTAAPHEQEHDQFTEDNAIYNRMIGESLRSR